MNEKQNQSMTLRLPAKLHERIKRIANQRHLSMQNFILEILEDEVKENEAILEHEDELNKISKKMYVVCEYCKNKVTFYDFKITGRTCPSCGKKVRFFKASK
jgi:ribosomal protein S27E